MLYRGFQSSSPEASKCSSIICFLRDARYLPHIERFHYRRTRRNGASYRFLLVCQTIVRGSLPLPEWIRPRSSNAVIVFRLAERRRTTSSSFGRRRMDCHRENQSQAGNPAPCVRADPVQLLSAWEGCCGPFSSASVRPQFFLRASESTIAPDLRRSESRTH